MREQVELMITEGEMPYIKETDNVIIIDFYGDGYFSLAESKARNIHPHKNR